MENKKEDFQRGIYKLATLLLVAFISQSGNHSIFRLDTHVP